MSEIGKKIQSEVKELVQDVKQLEHKVEGAGAIMHPGKRGSGGGGKTKKQLHKVKAELRAFKEYVGGLLGSKELSGRRRGKKGGKSKSERIEELVIRAGRGGGI